MNEYKAFRVQTHTHTHSLMNTELRGLGGFILEISRISKFKIVCDFLNENEVNQLKNNNLTFNKNIFSLNPQMPQLNK